VVKCKNCGFIYASPRPTEEALRGFYDESYYRSHEPIGYGVSREAEEAIRRRFETRLEHIAKYTGEPGRLLDLGCATGLFLEVAKGRGWEIYGVEFSDFAIPIAQNTLGIEIHPTLVEARFDTDYFDVVTGWEYIEHLAKPRRELEEIRRILRKDGLLALSTPNMRNLTAMRCSELWESFIPPPEHLSYFSPESLGQLLEAVGFGVEGWKGIVPVYDRPGAPFVAVSKSRRPVPTLDTLVFNEKLHEFYQRHKQVLWVPKRLLLDLPKRLLISLRLLLWPRIYYCDAFEICAIKR
jgi:SAM-dependent methyltransferase